MRVLSVVGNRPQFVKSAPLSVALRGRGIEEVLLHTGQHYDPELSAVFFEELGLPEPDVRLDLHTADVAAMTPAIADAVRAAEPDAVLVYGDTNSTLAGALAAVESGVPVAHVEAGLRSGDLEMPEERNRIEVDRLSTVLFAPDERSRETLAAEGVEGRVEVVGDVMADATMQFAPIARRRSRLLSEFELTPGRYVVATVHREANTRPARLARIVEGLDGLTEPVVFPVHPRTSAALERDGLTLHGHVLLLPPLGYLDFAALAAQARVIVTDSGGLQKEAYWYGVPCVTLRSSTEWADTVSAGANRLVDDDPGVLAEAVMQARMPSELPQLYGDGKAAAKIADVVSTLFRS
ncbi:MAG: UDP-N-acetylglucosamine 2-epimerase (non-hydrolyzing) [Actinobacteria bacterium]|nr:UDP-N-acetylglucosamine 2-epimerase (non-hydrolyzing) [Actinomycetota bacterium]